MKFLLGMLVGVGTGIAATLILTKEQDETPTGLVSQVQSSTRQALLSAKSAAKVRETELWHEFHERVPNPDQPILG